MGKAAGCAHSMFLSLNLLSPPTAFVQSEKWYSFPGCVCSIRCGHGKKKKDPSANSRTPSTDLK